MKYVEIYSDADGVSHFRDAEILFSPNKSEYQGHAVLKSDFKSTEAGFISVPSGWDSGWHNSPGDGFAILLQGKVKIEVGSGEVRKFASGDVWRSTDVSGHGHISRVVSAEDAKVYMANFSSTASKS